MALLHHPAFMELPADLNHVINLGFTGDFKGFFQFITSWILFFIVLAITALVLIILF